jgi:2-polyprenyl-3-methyl-5-hydroxy-6-metoxy-1,4-benzoquinol methylase
MLTYFPPRYLFRRYEILRQIRPATNFLEIGAGNLQLSQELLHYFEQGKALDFAQTTQADYAKLPLAIRERLSFSAGDFNQLELADNYDCIVCCEVMEHVADDLAFLSKLHALLKRKGQIVLSVPARMRFWSIHDDIVGHLRRYEKVQLLELFKQVGFQQVHIISYGYPFVNLFKVLRISHAKTQYEEKRQWVQQQQTQASGVAPVASYFKWFGILVNPYTFLPFNWLARLFNDYDLSDGYLVTAYK